MIVIIREIKYLGNVNASIWHKNIRIVNRDFMGETRQFKIEQLPLMFEDESVDTA